MIDIKTVLIKKSLLHILLIIGVFLSLAPLFVMLLDSFKLGTELSANSWGIPRHPVIENYVKLITYNGGVIARSYANAVFVSVSYTFLTICISAMAAYAFSKYRFKGGKVIFLIFIATMMIPTELTIPPLYILFSRIHWLNSYQVQIIPGIANVFVMFMIKQYMDSLPNSLIEAGRIDGAGHLRVFTGIMLPLAAPAVGAMTILTFISKWNDYLWPSIMLTKPKVMPIMVILPTLNDKNSVWSIPWELLMAGCITVTMPLIIVFMLFQDKFMSSMTMGAVKE